MFAIIGIVVTFGAVLGGYLMEHGNLRVLMQPAELLIIGGAGAGTVLIANPLHILKQIAAGVGAVFKGSKFTKQRYVDSLKLGYELLNKARRQGLMSLETDVEDPDQSPIFFKDPEFLKDAHVRHFFCDSMRMAISGVEAFDLDQLMEGDLEVQHHEATQPFRLSPAWRTRCRARNCRCCTGSGDHHECPGRSAGGNRAQGRCGARRDVSRNPALLWLSRSSGLEHVQGCRRRARLLERS